MEKVKKFGHNSDFWAIFRFLNKISILDHNVDFCIKFRFLDNIEIFDYNFDFSNNLKLVKFRFFRQFGQYLDFWRIFRFLYKISIFGQNCQNLQFFQFIFFTIDDSLHNVLEREYVHFYSLALELHRAEDSEKVFRPLK